MKGGRELMVGSVIIASILVAVVGTLWLQGVNWGREAIPVELLIRDVAQLTEGNAVKYRGVEIGEVTGVEVEPNGEAVRVFLELDQEVILPADAAVIVAPESFFGDWQAEIVSRSRFPRYDFLDVPPSELGREIVVLGGYPIPEISRLTASAEQIADNVASLSENLQVAFSNETAGNLSSAVANIEALTTDMRNLVNNQSRSAGQLTQRVDSVLLELAAASSIARSSFERIDVMLNSGDLNTMVNNVNDATTAVGELARGLGESTDELESTLAAADSAFRRFDIISAQIMRGEGALGRLMTDTTFAVRAENILTQLDLLFEDIRLNPRRYVRLSIF